MSNKTTRIFSNHHYASATVTCSSLILFICLFMICSTTSARADVAWSDDIVGFNGEDYALRYITAPDDDLLGFTVLTVLEPLLEGDANRDGIVSTEDYASVLANFGSVGIAGIHGDANLDGIVSASDYASIQANFGNVDADPDTPEPATLSLLALGGLAMLRRRRK